MIEHHTGHATGGFRIMPQTAPKYNKFNLNTGPQRGSIDNSIGRAGTEDRDYNSGMLIPTGRDQERKLPLGIEPRVSEERINRWLSSPESPENIQRILNTSRLQHMLQKCATHGGIENTFLFESIVGVS